MATAHGSTTPTFQEGGSKDPTPKAGLSISELVTEKKPERQRDEKGRFIKKIAEAQQHIKLLKDGDGTEEQDDAAKIGRAHV